MALASQEHPITQPELPRPNIEWPTVALGLACPAVIAVSTLAYFHTSYSWTPLWMAINSLAMYFSFTIVHEASHKNISRKHAWLNDGLAYIAAFLFHGSYRQFTPIHMKHHAHINDPALDPDYHVAGRVNPFKWSVTLYYYFRFFLREGFFWKAGSKGKVLILGPYVLIFALYGVCLFTGNFLHIVLIFGLPCLAASAITIFFFDYIPHYPHLNQGKYTNAQTIVGKGWSWMSMQQGYHVVHHLWPSIPWYRYGQVYRQRREEFLRAGHKEVRL